MIQVLRSKNFVQSILTFALMLLIGFSVGILHPVAGHAAGDTPERVSKKVVESKDETTTTLFQRPE